MLRFVSPSYPAKAHLTEFHIMKIGATPARLVAVVRTIDQQAALADVIAPPFAVTILRKSSAGVDHWAVQISFALCVWQGSQHG